MVPLTLEAYDANDNLVATANSAFSSNFVSGGGVPNEFISLSFGGGFSRVAITGDPLGNSFTLDDATITPVPVPEAGTLTLLSFGLMGMGLVRKKLGGFR